MYFFSDCECNPGGSVDNNCNKITGECHCKPRVMGQRCDEPMQLHYFPTLYQHLYEAEDGVTPQNTPVRYVFTKYICIIILLTNCNRFTWF